MTRLLLPGALLMLAATAAFADAPAGYHFEGCAGGTCRLVRDVSASPAFRQAGAAAQNGLNDGGPSAATEAAGPRAMPPGTTPSGATAASSPLSGGPVGPAAEVPPPPGCASCGGGKAAAQASGGGAAAKSGGGCPNCKKRGGLAGFFDAVRGFFSSLFG